MKNKLTVIENNLDFIHTGRRCVVCNEEELEIYAEYSSGNTPYTLAVALNYNEGCVSRSWDKVVYLWK